MDGKRYRRFTVEPCLNGFMVSVGCQWAVYTDIAVLLADIGQYLKDPEKKEQDMVQNSWAYRSIPTVAAVPPNMQDNIDRGNSARIESLQPTSRGIGRG